MPYVEGFGTWPFGEEWLWEAIATSYVPLLQAVPEDAPVTFTLTPVLADQLEAPGARERCLAFLEELRPESHRRDVASAQDPAVAAELEQSAADYARAAARLREIDLLTALGRRAAWTSSATHAVLPLLATDAGAQLQVRTGIEAHRRRTEDEWAGGFWLPECAHAPWLDPLLEQEGVRALCVDLTDVSHERGRPLRTPAGPLLLPLDREVVELVWSWDGYPSHGAYRNYHGYTEHRHRPWAIDGRVYSRERAAATAREHAADFVARIRARVAGGELCVCGLDTELLGHWWFEGPQWLAAVLGEAETQGLELTPLDAAAERFPAAEAPAGLPVTTWGTPRDLSTWSGPAVAGLAWEARAAELAVVAHAGEADAGMARELLALQSSDWAFLATHGTAGPYP